MRKQTRSNAKRDGRCRIVRLFRRTGGAIGLDGPIDGSWARACKAHSIDAPTLTTETQYVTRTKARLTSAGNPPFVSEPEGRLRTGRPPL